MAVGQPGVGRGPLALLGLELPRRELPPWWAPEPAPEPVPLLLPEPDRAEPPLRALAAQAPRDRPPGPADQASQPE
jgi:hypothetical protein